MTKHNLGQTDEGHMYEVSLGASCALWGFRACAGGQGGCPVLRQRFVNLMSEGGPAALSELQHLARALGTEGRRKITVGLSGCASVTGDELSVVAALAASQNADFARRDAHLTWLCAGAPSAFVATVCDRTAYLFARHGLAICAPQMRLPFRPNLEDATPARGVQAVH